MEKVMQSKTAWLDQTLRVSQLMASLVGVIMIVGGAYMSAMVNMNVQSKDIERNKEVIQELREAQKEQMRLLNEINASLQDMRVELKDKENRK